MFVVCVFSIVMHTVSLKISITVFSVAVVGFNECCKVVQLVSTDASQQKCHRFNSSLGLFCKEFASSPCVCMFFFFLCTCLKVQKHT